MARHPFSLKPFFATIGLMALSMPAWANSNGYAERVYADYAAATSGRLQLTIEVTGSGEMRSLRDQRVVDLTDVPAYTLVADEKAVQLENPRFTTPATESLYLNDLASRVDTFESVGRPLDQGRYRLLAVRASIGSDIRTHRAVEFCWPGQRHCVVYDPNIEFLDSSVQNLHTARANGWGPRVRWERAIHPINLNGASTDRRGRCGLASNPGMRAVEKTWPARTVPNRSLFGATVGVIQVGAASAGVRCDADCNAQPFGTTSVSSGTVVPPFTLACNSADWRGTARGRARYVGRTGCATRLVLKAKYNPRIEYQGASGSVDVEIALDSVGEVQENGGHHTDSCARF